MIGGMHQASNRKSGPQTGDVHEEKPEYGENQQEAEEELGEEEQHFGAVKAPSGRIVALLGRSRRGRMGN